jgi:hypothetical protein
MATPPELIHQHKPIRSLAKAQRYGSLRTVADGADGSEGNGGRSEQEEQSSHGLLPVLMSFRFSARRARA